MQIAINAEKLVVAHGNTIERGDFQGEKGLIKVTNDIGFYYIGTTDRDDYVFITVDTIPADIDQVAKYKYEEGFILVE